MVHRSQIAASLALSVALFALPISAFAQENPVVATAAATASATTQPEAPAGAHAVTAVAPAHATGATLSASKITLGQTVKISPTDGTNYQRYNYVWRYNHSWSEWSSTMFRTGSTTEDLSWDFTPTKAGVYDIYLDAVDPDGTTTTFAETLVVTHAASFDGVSLSANAIIGGSSVTVSAQMSGNLTGVQYRYNWAKKGDKPVASNAVQSSTPTWTFTPTSAGSYVVYVDVIHPDGAVETKQVQLTVSDPTLNPKASVNGTTLVLSSEGAALPKGTTYNFVWARNYSWDQWDSTIKSTGKATANTSATFSNLQSGTYVCYVDYMLPNGYKTTKGVIAKVERGWTVGAIQTNLQSPQPKHKALTYSVSVSGPRANRVKYNYVWMRDGWKDWWSNKRTGDATSSTSWTFTPKYSGSYWLYIDVIDMDTGETTTVAKSFKITRGWDATGVKLTFSSGTKLRPGSKVTASATVTGNKTGLSYNYVWNLNNWADWSSTLKETKRTTTATSRTWTAYAQGTYYFYIDVIDADGERETVSSRAVSCRSPQAVRNAVLTTLRGEVGNPRPDVYMNTLLNKGGRLCWGQTNAWCATYIWWGFNQNNANTAWCGGAPLSEPAQIRDWYRNRGRYSRSMVGIQPGDIILMSYWVRYGEPVTHVVICSGVWGDQITFIGGNPGAKEQTLPASSRYFYGYARTDWNVL